MNYNELGHTGLQVSRFGFGCMRFPTRKIRSKKVIDRKESTRMIRHAIENGVNYFDTAYVYPGSEETLGRALKGGYRKDIHIAGKNPLNLVHNRKDLDRFLNEELKRLKTDFLDVHLLHSLSSERWEKCQIIDAFRFLEDAKRAGKIRLGGFSFHGSLQLFKEIIDAYEWDVTQIQLNYMDINHQAGLEGFQYATNKGIPVIIMEPLKGGGLTDKLPSDVTRVIEEFPTRRSPAEWSFRWLIDKPDIPVVLSGVSTMEQLQENIRIFSDTDPGCMTPEDRSLIDKIIAEFSKVHIIECTHCGYCLPCPSGVDIPEVFKFYNELGLKSGRAHANWMYQVLSKEDKNGADQCTECGTCEPLCPQSIPIIEKLKESHITLTSK